MDCSDFERYLDIFLDGKLGRTRTVVLGRHLASCRACRKRLDELRSFERDLHRRFRSMRNSDAIWASIGMEAFEGAGQSLRIRGSLQTEPPPAPPQVHQSEAKRHPLLQQLEAPPTAPSSRRKWMMAGLAIVGLAAVARPAMWALGVTTPADPYIESYRAYLSGGQVLEVASADRREVAAWLDARLGFKVPVPVPPKGMSLRGGLVVTLDHQRAAQIVYDQDGTPIVLFVSHGRSGAESERIDATDGSLNRVGWSNGRFDFEAVAPLEPEKLEALKT